MAKEWNGVGWYRIGYSDGGMDWTNDGPLWMECESQLDDELEAARYWETETHLAYAEYMGCSEEIEISEYDPDVSSSEYRTVKKRDYIDWVLGYVEDITIQPD